MEILKATASDLERILELQKACYLEEARLYDQYDIPPLTETLESVMDQFQKGIILKCTEGDLLVGSVRAFEKADTCYIGKLIVRKEFQNRGIGVHLMNAIEGHFKTSTRFELFTGHKSEKNLYLYSKLKYLEFKRTKINEALSLVFLEKFAHA